MLCVGAIGGSLHCNYFSLFLAIKVSLITATCLNYCHLPRYASIPSLAIIITASDHSQNVFGSTFDRWEGVVADYHCHFCQLTCVDEDVILNVVFGLRWDTRFWHDLTLATLAWHSNFYYRDFADLIDMKRKAYVWTFTSKYLTFDLKE